MKNICVFCGSGEGNNPVFKQVAIELGALLAKKGKRLVYGGGNIGLMGIVADTVLKNGGEVIGVIPDFLMKREVGHLGLTELIVVKSMHERKQKMAELADGFIAMPGGFGTLEELAEIVTWVQLKLIDKPVALLNVAHYYNNLISQVDMMLQNEFTSGEHREILKSADTPQGVLEIMANHQPDDHTDLKKS